MSNQGKELTQEIAVDLIVELFGGQSDVELAYIKNEIDKLHTKRGGHESNRKAHPVIHALYALKTLGLADNKNRGYWCIYLDRDLLNIIKKVVNRLKNTKLSYWKSIMNVENRTIFEGDNLHILRGLDSETIDLIYLDPPFNSNRTYQAPIGSEAAGAAFRDSWTLSDLDNAWHGELAEREPGLYSAISAAEFSHGKSMKAYLIMMGIRMLEMRRILKPTGNIYLHCDPTASHYLKMMMDSIFGQQNFGMRLLGDIPTVVVPGVFLPRNTILFCFIQKQTMLSGETTECL